MLLLIQLQNKLAVRREEFLDGVLWTSRVVFFPVSTE